MASAVLPILFWLGLLSATTASITANFTLTSTSTAATNTLPTVTAVSHNATLAKGQFLPIPLPTSGGTTASLVTANLTSTTSATTSPPPPPSSTSTPTSATTFETLPEPMSQSERQPVAPQRQHSTFKWNSVTSGQQNSLSYKLNCTPDFMSIEVNLTGVEEPFVYLEKLKTFSICRPQILNSMAIFNLALDDNFYRCGTTKVHDQLSGTRIYYNRVLVESKGRSEPQSIYFKCSLPSASAIFGGSSSLRTKRQLVPTGPGRLVNFTEIDLPDNFMEAEILDFDQNITARAPYPHLNLKVKRNGQFVNTSLNVAPGTPLEMIIYLDDESKTVYGLLASFLKVTDNSSRPKEEVIVLNGCSIDPYIFGNFETPDNGDSVSAKFRAFKFPESNYVMFVGTVNVCLDACKGVPCGNDIVAYGRRRRRRSIREELPRDPNKVFEIEMITYLQVGYSNGQLEAKKNALRGTYDQSDPKAVGKSKVQYAPSKLTLSANENTANKPITSKWSNAAGSLFTGSDTVLVLALGIATSLTQRLLVLTH